MSDDTTRGLYRKYKVTRLNDPAEKHADCEYYVLDWRHDKYAIPAALAYAAACEGEFPDLAADLRQYVRVYGPPQSSSAPQPPSSSPSEVLTEKDLRKQLACFDGAPSRSMAQYREAVIGSHEALRAAAALAVRERDEGDRLFRQRALEALRELPRALADLDALRAERARLNEVVRDVARQRDELEARLGMKAQANDPNVEACVSECADIAWRAMDGDHNDGKEAMTEAVRKCVRSIATERDAARAEVARLRALLEGEAAVEKVARGLHGELGNGLYPDDPDYGNAEAERSYWRGVAVVALASLRGPTGGKR